MKTILKDIRDKIKAEQRTPETLFGEVKGIGARMFLTRQMYRADVVTLCADLLAMYSQLSGQNLQDWREEDAF